jgi:hypothetical protein
MNLDEAIEDAPARPHCGERFAAKNTGAPNIGASGSERLPTVRRQKCAAEHPFRDGILDFLSPLDNKANP